MNAFSAFSAICLMIGVGCGLLALLGWLKQRRDAARNWHVGRGAEEGEL